MKRSLLIVLVLCLAGIVHADIGLMPENPERPSENFRKVLNGFLDGYYQRGMNYKVHLKSIVGQTIPVVKEEKNSFVLDKDNLKRSLFMPESSQVDVWLKDLSVPPDSTVIMLYNKNLKGSDIITTTKVQLAKKKILHKDLIIGAEIYDTMDKFFEDMDVEKIGPVLLFENSDYIAIQKITKMKVIKPDAAIYIFQEVLTNRLLSNITDYEGLTVVIPTYSAKSLTLFNDMSDQDRKPDIYYFLGYTLGLSDIEVFDIVAVPVTLKGFEKKFNIVTR